MPAPQATPCHDTASLLTTLYPTTTRQKLYSKSIRPASPMARSNKDPKCIQHARFASHLDRAHFDIIYWALFVVVIFMLFAASWRYGRSIDEVANFTPGTSEHRRRMKHCMLVCGIYACISVVGVVMEVFALMALQFCDGEDLMALYWSTWTVMQIGSLIAIFGILLAVFHTIRGRKHPPWALALGTPVLVVAGLGHIIQGALHKKVKSVRGRSSVTGVRLRGISEDRGTTTTETPQAVDYEKDESELQYSARLLGYTPDGATILQFCQPSSVALDALLSPSTKARILGTNDAGQVIVAFRDGRASLTCPTDERAKAAAAPEPPAQPSGTSVRVQEPLRGQTTAPDSNVGRPLSVRTTNSLAPAASSNEHMCVTGSPSGADETPPASRAFVAVARSDSPPSRIESSLTLHTPRGATSE